VKLLYVANTRIPTEKAHGWAIMKMCESFALAGHAVELVLPKRKNPHFESVDAFHYYDIKKNFEIVFVPCPDLITITGRLPRLLGLLLGIIQNWLYARAVYGHLQKQHGAIIFSREHRLLYFLRTLPNKLVYEVHDFPERHKSWYQKLFERVDIVVVTNQWKKNEITKRFGTAEEKIFVAPNAIDVEAYAHPLSKQEARQKLSISQNKKIVLYMGGFQRWKGVYVLGEALQYLSNDIEVIFVGGGAEPDRGLFIEWLGQQGNDNFFVHDHVEHQYVPLWLWAADVLALPGTAEDKNAFYYTSPLKLFEYIASGRPVVMTDVPAVREVFERFGLDIPAAYVVPPDNAHVLAVALNNSIEQKGVSWPVLASHKLFLHTWQARARGIADFIEKC